MGFAPARDLLHRDALLRPQMQGVDDDALASIKRGSSQIMKTLISPCRSFRSGLARQAVELVDIEEPLAFNVDPQVHGARRASDRSSERGGKRAFSGPRQTADGNQIEPARSEKIARARRDNFSFRTLSARPRGDFHGAYQSRNR
jgi:hypothetical protein